MAATNENSLRRIADAALKEKDGEAAAKLYDQLVEEVKLVVGGGQKEIAAELQRLAKEMESEGLVQQAFDFKQQTCAVLLKLSMAARVRPGAIPPVAPTPFTPTSASTRAVPVPDGVWRLDFLLRGCADYEQELQLFTESLKANVTWSSQEPGGRAAALSTGAGPLIVLSELALPGWQPLFTVPQPEDAFKRLDELGWKQEGARCATPLGEACQFRNRSGIIIAIVSPAERR